MQSDRADRREEISKSIGALIGADLDGGANSEGEYEDLINILFVLGGLGITWVILNFI